METTDVHSTDVHSIVHNNSLLAVAWSVRARFVRGVDLL